MHADRITANLPSRDFDATVEFYGKLGFVTSFRDDGWMVMTRVGATLEFFPHPRIEPRTTWFSACYRVGDLDGLHRLWQGSGIPLAETGIPRLTRIWQDPGAPRLFAVVDPDGSLLRVLQDGGA